MKRILLFLTMIAAGPSADGRPKNDYPIRPVPFTEVQLSDAFWASRIETNRRVTRRSTTAGVGSRSKGDLWFIAPSGWITAAVYRILF
jgi:hypothetical protein